MPMSAQSKNDLKRAKDLLEQGDKAFRQKNYRDAADQYGRAIVLVPNNPYAHFFNGFAHFNLGEPDRALDEFTIALSQGYKPIDIYRVRSHIYITQKKYDEALEDIRKGLALQPKDVGFLSSLGDVNVFLNYLTEALDAYQRAVLLAPKNGDLYVNIARVQLAIGNTKAQGSAAEAALKTGTQFMGEAYYLLGDSCQKQKNIPGAIDAYQRAISAKPDSYPVYRSLADIFRSENRFTDAINVSKQALRQYPNDGNIYTDISWYYSLADRPEDAIQAAKAANMFLPNQYLAYTNLCRAYNETKQYQLAITACNSALKLNPKDGETNFYLGRSYDFLGKPSEATKYYERAVVGLVEYTKNNPEYSDGFYLLGNAYFADNQRDNAIDAYGKCLALSPRFVKAMYNLGIIQVLKKNKDAAMEQYNNLLQLDAALAAKLKIEIDKM